MNDTKAGNRILSLVLAICLLLGTVLYLPGPVAVMAALPDADGAGKAWDGVDFGALGGSGIYYGTYDHATALSSTTWGDVADTEGEDTPILWRVYGEDSDSGRLTLWSEYVLDSREYNPRGNANNRWADSYLREWLQDVLSQRFSAGELALIPGDVTVTSGAGESSANTAADQRFYLPWAGGTGTTQPVRLEAEDADQGLHTGDTAGYLKGGGQAAQYWLRSPVSGISNLALYGYEGGGVRSSNVSGACGVRPIFQLDPTSVIFASRISDDADGSKGETQSGSNYSAQNPGGGSNYKLTVINSDLAVTGLNGPDESGPLEKGGEVLPLKSGGVLRLTGSVGGGADYLAYKIVDRNSGGIVGYGMGAGADIHIRGVANVTDGAPLSTSGRYTLYVWAQKDGGIHSHEGSLPLSFQLQVKEAALPTVTGVFPDGKSVSLGTSSLSVTFDEDMDTALPGSVSIDRGATLEAKAWEGQRTVTYALRGLEYGTTYTIGISGFRGLSGGVMEPHTHTFATVAPPLPGQHAVTVAPVPAGGGKPTATPVHAAEGERISLAANPNQGWQFTHWSASPAVDIANEKGLSTTFPMPDGNVMITAHYRQMEEGGGPDPEKPDPEKPAPVPGTASEGRSSRSGGDPVEKASLPASAFSWDGVDTLTVNHERITARGLLWVWWDGKLLAPATDYTARQGSVIIRFSQELMAAQSPGEHTVRVEFVGHTGQTAVTVGETSPDWEETYNPSTGGFGEDRPAHTGGRGIWTALLLGSLAAALPAALRPRPEGKQ